MIVHDPEGYEKKKDEERRMNTPDDVKKERLFEEFRKESVSIIYLAFMYAKNFGEMGYDITEKWVTAEQQAEVLQTVQKKAYLEGYEYGFTKKNNDKANDGSVFNRPNRKGRNH